MKVLVTGCAGFIGMHVSKLLLDRGEDVIGVDNMNNYYDVRLKEERLKFLKTSQNFNFILGDISDSNFVKNLFSKESPEKVINLAAQAGVRYSLQNPIAYIQSNIVGFCNILEGCRDAGVKHLVYASSSSVYGGNDKVPFSVDDRVDHPVSLYAATKKSNELMAHAYTHLYGIPTTGLRYFTVYGPWGRPDMSPWLFTSAMLEGRSIKVFNNGHMERDFTYIDDIAEGTCRVLDRNLAKPYKIYNIGNQTPVKLMYFIEELERGLNLVAQKEYLPMQAGDVLRTYADVSELITDVGFSPKVGLDEGIKNWLFWYQSFNSKVAGVA
jgi:UDP-glucuronate 4-epimerase